MSPILQASVWGFVSGGALVVGAAVGYFVAVPKRVVAYVMAFGSGVLISALSFELMEEAFKEAGLLATATGFLLGAAIYAAANRLLAMWGAKHRKRSGEKQPSEEESEWQRRGDRGWRPLRWNSRIDCNWAQHPSWRRSQRGDGGGNLPLKSP